MNLNSYHVMAMTLMLYFSRLEISCCLQYYVWAMDAACPPKWLLHAVPHVSGRVKYVVQQMGSYVRLGSSPAYALLWFVGRKCVPLTLSMVFCYALHAVPFTYAFHTSRELGMDVHNVQFPSEAQIEGVEPTPSHIENTEEIATSVIIPYRAIHENDNNTLRYEDNDGIQVLDGGVYSEHNIRNNIDDESFRQFVHSVHVDAISSHRHPRIVLRSDPHNIPQTSNSIPSSRIQPMFNCGPTIHTGHNECDRQHVQTNMWSSYPRSDEIAINAHSAFRSRIDRLSIVHMCHVCNESYVGMKVFQTNEGPKCARCKSERGAHRFSVWNKMDPKEQPYVLAVLTQVEEMLIARVSPILQVLHAPRGQYKYSGHTISFPQDIHNVTSSLPYYAGIVVDEDAVQLLPERAIDISNRLSTITLEMNYPMHETDGDANIDGNEDINGLHHPSSFASRRPNTVREMEQIRVWLQNAQGTARDIVDWPKLGASSINEYNTEGLFDMAFPTLFPTSDAEWLQPRSTSVRLHEYAEHLMKYRDHRFTKHPRFRYFIMNMIMRHRSQATSAIFVKKNAKECLPTIIEELHTQLETLPDTHLAEKVMKFGTTLRGTRAYWSKCLCELSDMIHQIGCPTIFFTLSAADMQWPDLHQLMPGTPPRDAPAARRWRCNNVIQHPHIVAKYMHLRHTIFREEILTKFHGAIEFWSRYEWQHRGSPHVHGFLWLNGAPDMDRLDWENPETVEHAKNFFDKIVHAWNPRDAHHRNIQSQRNAIDDPCLLHTNQIFQTDMQRDYENLLNRVERHTICSEGYCLRKKGRVLKCRYNAPWQLRNESVLLIDEQGKKLYEPRRNDDRVNVHNADLLVMWRANVNWQPVTSTYVVLRYIAKYAAKSEKASESYHDMLLRITSIEDLEEPTACAYKQFLSETIVDRDIGAQETCHMLLSLPLVECSRAFVALNVSRKVFQRIQGHGDFILPDNTFINAYMHRPREIEHLPLIEVARSWTYSERRKNEPWKLALYKPFRSFADDIRIEKDIIIENWRAFTYRAWHIRRTDQDEIVVDDDDDDVEFQRSTNTRDYNEWEIISGLMNARSLPFSDLDMLGAYDTSPSLFSPLLGKGVVTWAARRRKQKGEGVQENYQEQPGMRRYPSRESILEERGNFEEEEGFEEEEYYYDDDDEEEEDRSLDLLARFIQNIFKKMSKRARKATSAILPSAISPQLCHFPIRDQPCTQIIGFDTNGRVHPGPPQTIPGYDARSLSLHMSADRGFCSFP
eukprot:Gb_06945 [translate_table: standard]